MAISYDASLPLNQYVGLKFMPTDLELLQYLYCKIHGHGYYQEAVFDCDLYGGSEPWEIWQCFGGVDGRDLYFFTKLKKSINKSGNLSAHINRKIGLADGTWSGENSATPIVYTQTRNEQTIIGYRKRFRYENDHLPEHHGEWIMHEYSLNEDLICKGVDPNYVLCRIRKNERPKRKLSKQGCELQQSRKKRIAAPQITLDERTKINQEKRDFYELQPTEQKVTTSQMNYNVSCESNMTCDSNVVTDMTFDSKVVPDMTMNSNTVSIDLDIVHCVPKITTDQGFNYVPSMPDMTTNQDTSDTSHVPQMIEDVPYSNTDEEWINFLSLDDINRDFQGNF